MISVAEALPKEPEKDARNALERGDRQHALTVLMEAYGDAIYRHVRQVVRDADLADDVHQTVFVQAYRDFHQYRGQSSLKTWLYRIARHRCLDALKARNRWRRRITRENHTDARVDPSLRADERLIRSVESLQLEQALDALKPKVRIAVLLRYGEGMSYEDMATVCGERAATLQARVARAMPKLRNILEDTGGRE
jgi:RNA polymerase sigma-70 factor (ECF subfamily)